MLSEREYATRDGFNAVQEEMQEGYSGGGLEGI